MTQPRKLRWNRHWRKRKWDTWTIEWHPASESWRCLLNGELQWSKPLEQAEIAVFPPIVAINCEGLQVGLDGKGGPMDVESSKSFSWVTF